MTTGLTIMRMQPFHKGHKRIVDTMLAENDQAFILIGSANKKDEHNPLPYNVRKMMILKLYWKEIRDGKLKVFPIDDINNPPKWVEHSINQIGGVKPDKYYCGTGQDGRLFAEKGFEIRSFDREEIKISATMVREKISSNDKTWQELVPEEIIPLIEKFYPKQEKTNVVPNNTIAKKFTQGER